MIGKLLGLGRAAHTIGSAVGGVAEVFVGNRAERDAADHERYVRSLAQFGEEFTHPGSRWFDGFVNGLNRLPRPMMAIGTLGMFSYAMAEPEGFALRMQGLAYVPEPLWWLLGAIVSFYFGARELHHYRGRSFELPPLPLPRREPQPALPAPGPAADTWLEPQPQASRAAPVAEPAFEAPAAHLPAPDRPTAVAPVPVRAGDPTFNAALEEWRAARA